ncbi:energy transducer TonB [Arenibacter algicola]|jgi:protein TonB|uniref:Energy transducer TonB n=1 Tax=Arenibacter algicola TaxID=616991 RepID=A0A221UWH7_9FLAO|nr:energy transducer TonB [Arenibacter algicola]ASO05739.1 energy transducer TonB [Arenibacter algicola]HCO86317.1 energy transducer TonB [Arenibacter sp.]|tara:strand:- start:29583 stop:30293 length:711 start_codon:yes stop_codon:yes gene_type:complete|eukprot:TRINITY_DN5313_c0_g2_i1.p2 TRINITY_DN5313_c0_g2~~TRINITY_DN5313_c0_g2_i1.p2  ORF type:complete len:237 (+),score=54.43 TRINITY_DN5313_c0_g2_i1:444-1154(+)
MELKKNPKADLTRNSGLYFVIGLVLVMALTYIAFEWKTYDDENNFDYTMNVEDTLDEEVPMTEQIKTPPPPPPPAAPEIIEVVEDEEEVEETVIESTETSQEEEVIEVADVEVEEVEEDIDVPFAVIEDVPIFPGCENEPKNKLRDCFNSMMQKHIGKNFRYPEIAQEMGVQGRVNVMFVIQKDGSIGNVRMRGPDKNLEEEAARIISKLPKMTPGKQRGRPVRVPFSIPITFKLQ